MKKLPIIIMLSAAGITGVAMAQTSSSQTPPNTEIGNDLGSYGKTSGASGSKVTGSSGMDGASGTTGYGTSSQGSMNGSSATTGYGTSGTTTAPTATKRGNRSVTQPSGMDGGTASPEIGEQLETYGTGADNRGSKLSPSYGKRGSGSQTTTAPSTTGMTRDGSSMTSGGITWTCPSGYTLSTATRDGTPLCYPNSGPMPGR